MKAKQQFSKEFKEAIVKKLLGRGQQTLSEFCRQNNLAISTVSGWKTECASVPEMNSKKNKSKLSAENILKIISETYSLNEEDLGLYLRKHGLHNAQIDEWRSSFLESVSRSKEISKKDIRDLRIKDLEKDLNKKDKALAEVSALLILQKKANLLWPDPIKVEVV